MDRIPLHTLGRCFAPLCKRVFCDLPAPIVGAGCPGMGLSAGDVPGGQSGKCTFLSRSPGSRVDGRLPWHGVKRGRTRRVGREGKIHFFRGRQEAGYTAGCPSMGLSAGDASGEQRGKGTFLSGSLGNRVDGRLLRHGAKRGWARREDREGKVHFFQGREEAK